jgi:phosphinothricin acetyltransferase
MPEGIALRSAEASDGMELARIYNHYVANTVVTFEEAAVSAEEMSARIAKVVAAGLPWLVAPADYGLSGYACAVPWKSRSAYRHSVEVTVYLDPGATGRGLGSALYRELFERLAARGSHALLGGISLPNEASVALHEKFGMRKVAHLLEVGYKFGRWIDVGYWQRLLPERPRGRDDQAG